ncbi:MULTISPECIES: hypothetical protein [unclassified Streptomyces]|uniref:hypothetical protein n=1 Tax=unclassified Streptomyces TaxID=2593676 RepID=UPI001F040C48|nr:MULTISPECIES: hypothetical protein [unclassified Streptomyces]MCH0563140.1 hypothetical protein [Streptomyces sp. MUM 2J]MCH0568569.1 hypothetical protein [Streptomyces sp. MUM 136J]
MTDDTPASTPAQPNGETSPETSGEVPAETSPEAPGAQSLERQRLEQETKDERKVWYFLAYFLFGIHFVAFVMIYAVRHAK